MKKKPTYSVLALHADGTSKIYRGFHTRKTAIAKITKLAPVVCKLIPPKRKEN